MYNVLFLCTGNSARSIIAEALLNHLGGDRCRAFSAGSQPKGAVNPFSLEILRVKNLAVTDLRSKSWEEFATADAPKMDIVITVCDNAAGETCPLWSGQPIKAHWSFTDPAAVEGSDETKLAAFESTFNEIAVRIRMLLALPLANLNKETLQQHLQALNPALQN